MPYSFAVEYEGPAISHHDLPQAVPIDVFKIPLAEIVPQSVCFSGNNKHEMPIVYPIVIDNDNDIDLGNQHSVLISSGEFSDVINSSICSSLVSHDQDSCSEILGFSDSFENSATFRNLNHDWESSNGSGLSFESLKNESVCYANNASNPAVTSPNVESENDEFLAEFSPIETKREPNTKARKGACYRCEKGNRFTEKEVCIVCDSKYCSNCVLRAMGSMPEGRKCVACIGFSINESKRSRLGKCSRMLKKLLSISEIAQMMLAEKSCANNQFPSENVCVNRKPLSHEELLILQNCPNPPKKIKQGNFWYDKVSGLWGKEGEKPCKIISPHLNVGGPILADASNGNTGVFINGREITKVEHRMLQLSGVQCAGNPHFWVNEDGSYQEEGQKNTRGYIWGKAGTKLICAVLSLPFPQKSVYSSEEQAVNKLSQTSYFDHNAPLKILLTGCSGSGTSTIFKQTKILYKENPFSVQERERIKLIIQSNVYRYLGILLEGRERFEYEALNENRAISSSGNPDPKNEETVYSICPRLKPFSDWLIKTMVSGNLESVFPVASREYAPVVEELWNHKAVQATYKRRMELDTLPSISGYFLEQAAEILKTDYIPSDTDILYAEHVTSSNGLSCVDFSFPENNLHSTHQHDSELRFQLIRLQAKGVSENIKWLEMFEEVQLVIFCVSLSDYDQYTINDNGNAVNKMLVIKKLFETLVSHPAYDQTNFLLALTKFDVFEENLEQVALTSCEWFSEFQPVVSRNSGNRSISSHNINHTPSMGQMGSHHVAVKFKRLYTSLTGRKLFVSVVNGLEPDSVDKTLKYAREILEWDEERHNFSFDECSVYST